MRFTLERDHWYAMELLGPEFGPNIRHHSPIRILGVRPQGKGDGQFVLKFFHANYPEGVQNKTYGIQTIDRKENYLLGRVTGSELTVLLFELSGDWLEASFGARLAPSETPETWVKSALFNSTSSPVQPGPRERYEETIEEFFEIFLKSEVLEEHGLPNIGYPVASSALRGLLDGSIDADFKLMLYWLQERSEKSDIAWRQYHPAMQRMIEILTTPSDADVMFASSDRFWLEVGPVDLGEDVVTVQRQGKLIAAVQPREDGTLRVAAYCPMDAGAIVRLVALGQLPGPDGKVSMRESNWELALDSSAGFGQMYSSDESISYFSRWEFGMGISADGSVVEEWIVYKDCPPLPVSQVVKQIAIHEVMAMVFED